MDIHWNAEEEEEEECSAGTDTVKAQCDMTLNRSIKGGSPMTLNTSINGPNLQINTQYKISGAF